MGRKKPPVDDTATIWFHPQQGVRVEPNDVTCREPWQKVVRVRAIKDGRTLAPDPTDRPRLPRGFLWADPSKQRFGLGGPALLYGPLEKTCRDCREPFVFTAGAQRGLYEDAKADLAATQVRCFPCVHQRRELEAARVEYAAALRTLAASPTGANHADAARAALRVLETGGRAGIERAIGQCRKARKLGVDTMALERRLAAHRR